MKPRSTSSEGHGLVPTPDDADYELSWTCCSLQGPHGGGGALRVASIDCMVTSHWHVACDDSHLHNSVSIASFLFINT